MKAPWKKASTMRPKAELDSWVKGRWMDDIQGWWSCLYKGQQLGSAWCVAGLNSWSKWRLSAAGEGGTETSRACKVLFIREHQWLSPLFYELGLTSLVKQLLIWKKWSGGSVVTRESHPFWFAFSKDLSGWLEFAVTSQSDLLDFTSVCFVAGIFFNP